MPPDPGEEPRKSSTRQNADNYINGLKKCGKLSKKGVTKDGHEYYKVMEKVEYNGTQFKKGDYLSRDELHHEWEWFRGKDKHQGAIDSITGKLNTKKQDFSRLCRHKIFPQTAKHLI